MPNQRDGFTTVLDLGANVDCTRRAPAAVRGHGQRARRRGRGAWPSRASACSTSAKKRSRAARRSSGPASCCAPRPRPGSQLPRQRRRQRHLQGHPDIVVCDGFVGNVALKTAEGLASMLTSFVKEEFNRNRSPSSPRWPPCRCCGVCKPPRRPPALQRRGACSACAGWSSRATARPTRSRSSRRSNRAYEAARNGLLDRVRHRISATLARAMADHRDRSAEAPVRASRRIGLTARHDTTTAPRYSRITGTGSFLPPDRLSNAALAERLAADGIETSDEWIVERTGIRFRHFAAPDVACSDLGAEPRRGARSRPPIATRRRSTSSSSRPRRPTWSFRRPPAWSRKSSACTAARRSTCRRCARASSTRSRSPTR